MIMKNLIQRLSKRVTYRIDTNTTEKCSFKSKIISSHRHKRKHQTRKTQDKYCKRRNVG